MILTKHKLKLIIKEELQKELNEAGAFKKAMIGAGAAIASMMPNPASAKQLPKPPPYTSPGTHYSLSDMEMFLKAQKDNPEIKSLAKIYQDILSKGNAEATNDAVQELADFANKKTSIQTFTDRLKTIKARLFGSY